MRLQAAGSTDVGRERDCNEDCFLTVADEGLFVVCDGMGGHNSGEVASAMAAEEVQRFVCETRHQLGVPVSTEARCPEEVALVEAVRLANEKIFYRSCNDADCEGMGTTVVAALDAGESIVFSHVGDSRIYRLRDRRLQQLTEDHSLLNHLIKSRRMSAQEVEEFEGKNVILRAVGLRDDVAVDTRVEPKLPGDVYLLCSDGLTDMVSDEDIAECLEDHLPDLTASAQALVDAANEGGGCDNITALLVRVVVEIPPPPPHRALPPLR